MLYEKVSVHPDAPRLDTQRISECSINPLFESLITSQRYTGVVPKQKTWVAIGYKLPSADRSQVHKRLFGYRWAEKKKIGDTIKQPEAAMKLISAAPFPDTAVGERRFKTYPREIRGEMESIPYSKLGSGVILVPPNHADQAVRVLRSHGCSVEVRGGVATSDEQYQASNAYFLGQWQSYLSALDALLMTIENGKDSQAIMVLSVASQLCERFLKEVRALPVPAIPEDLVMLSAKPLIDEALKAYKDASAERASIMHLLGQHVKAQLRVLHEQGRMVLSAL